MAEYFIELVYSCIVQIRLNNFGKGFLRPVIPPCQNFRECQSFYLHVDRAGSSLLNLGEGSNSSKIKSFQIATTYWWWQIHIGYDITFLWSLLQVVANECTKTGEVWVYRIPKPPLFLPCCCFGATAVFTFLLCFTYWMPWKGFVCCRIWCTAEIRLEKGNFCSP